MNEQNAVCTKYIIILVCTYVLLILCANKAGKIKDILSNPRNKYFQNVLESTLLHEIFVY